MGDRKGGKREIERKRGRDEENKMRRGEKKGDKEKKRGDLSGEEHKEKKTEVK